jgi:hypothetical protein
MAAGKRRRRPRKPPRTLEQILAWADAHFARKGAWPAATSGCSDRRKRCQRDRPPNHWGDDSRKAQCGKTARSV